MGLRARRIAANDEGTTATKNFIASTGRHHGSKRWISTGIMLGGASRLLQRDRIRDLEVVRSWNVCVRTTGAVWTRRRGQSAPPTSVRGWEGPYWQQDIKNGQLWSFMGGNAAEAHPCASNGVKFEAKIEECRKLVVIVDPRFTRTASVARPDAAIRGNRYRVSPAA